MRNVLVLITLLLVLGCVDDRVDNFQADPNVPTKSISGFSATNRFYSGDSTISNANVKAFSAWVVFRSHRVYEANNSFIFGKSNRSTSGWLFQVRNGGYTFNVGGSNWPSGASAKVPSKYQIVGTSPNEDNYITVLHGVVRNGMIHLYKNGKATGEGVPITDTTYLRNGNGIAIGASPSDRGDGDYMPFPGKIVACGIADATALTDSDVEEHYQRLVAGAAYARPVGATHLWRAADAGSSWTDIISGLEAKRTGTIEPVLEDAMFYPRFDRYWDYSSTEPILPALPNTEGGIDVMCIGDSRTIGGHVSYRYMSWTLAKATTDMNQLRFVGPGNDAGYNNYWARGGSAAGNFLRRDCCNIGDLKTTIMTYDPDIVVLWFGHNALDDRTGSYLKSDYLELIRVIHSIKSDIRFLLLSELVASQEGSDVDAKHQDFSNWLQRDLAPQLDREGIKARICFIYDALDPATDFVDTIHPVVPDPITEMVGYNKVGVKVWPVLRLTAGYR